MIVINERVQNNECITRINIQKYIKKKVTKMFSAANPKPKGSRRSTGIKSILRQFRKAKSGVAAIEFAMTMPILIMLVAASINFGHVIYVQHSMQAIAGEALRTVSYGQMDFAEAKTFAKDQLSRVGKRAAGRWQVSLVENTASNEITITISVAAKHASLMPFPFVSPEVFTDELRVELIAPVITAFNPTT